METFTFETFRNATDLKFTQIESEAYRTYVFPDREVTIVNPIALNVSKSGGHRVFDAQGVSHYVPSGWIHLHWKARSEKPHFVK